MIFKDEIMEKINLQRISIKAPALANNKLNDKLQREVCIYLPPSYHLKVIKHYPVVYLIHGFGGTAEGWFSDDLALHQISDQLINSADINEMIIVVPENGTTQTCSAYLDSPIQGNWQTFICQDLVSAIEAKYRCKQGWQNRAIVGHSSGGDAVLKTLFLSPNIFKHGFAMSAPSIGMSSVNARYDTYKENLTSLQQANNGEISTASLSVWAHTVLSCLQISFPDENNAPLYCKFPLNEDDWKVLERGTHSALYQAYKVNLTNINLALDVGLKENFLEQTRGFVGQMQDDGFPVKLYEFDGGHVDHMAKSMPYVLTYISDCFSAAH
jgi:S-formylglutathione hydrolase